MSSCSFPCSPLWKVHFSSQTDPFYLQLEGKINYLNSIKHSIALIMKRNNKLKFRALINWKWVMFRKMIFFLYSSHGCLVGIYYSVPHCNEIFTKILPTEQDEKQSDCLQEGRKKMFYLKMHSTYFIYSYMASGLFTGSHNLWRIQCSSYLWAPSLYFSRWWSSLYTAFSSPSSSAPNAERCLISYDEHLW